MRTISSTSTHPPVHVHTQTHTDSYPILTWETTQPLTKSLCVCVFGVYSYEASKDNRDSEAVMCKGRDQTRSLATASLEELVLSSGNCEEISCVFLRKVNNRARSSREEDALNYSICQSVSANSMNNKTCQNVAQGKQEM